jgi:hypothetical protein
MFGKELFRDCSELVQIAGVQPTLSAAVATCGEERFAKGNPPLGQPQFSSYDRQASAG